MSDLFDYAEGQARKERGMALTEMKNADFVTHMRRERDLLAAKQGSVHIDDLRRIALELGIKPKSGAAWGTVLGGKGWRKIGYRASAWPGNHGHVSPVWARGEAA